jgi:hypothetical protein
MPIDRQAALVDIATAKDQKLTYQPLLVAEFLMVDGTYRRFCTENLDSTIGGFQYKGHDWSPRMSKQTLGQLQAVSDNGIVQLPQVSIDLADADKFLWITDEVGPQPIVPGTMGAPGYKGAKLVLKFIFWEAETGNFSNDEQIKFVGVCNSPHADEKWLTVSAINILNLNNFNLPQPRIGRTCPWVFPTNHADRVAGALKQDSDFFECGYSPDVTNADDPVGSSFAVGNFDPSQPPNTPYTDCPYTWEGCIARLGNVAAAQTTNSESTFVQIEKDKSGRRTGRFGGIRYDPPLDWRGREYVSGNTSEQINNPNDAKYTDYFPQVYGTAFVDPPVMFVAGSANFTRFDVCLGMGPLNGGGFGTPGPVQLVLVNDYMVPFRLRSSDPTILGWAWVNDGSRNGHVSRDTILDGRGDCYGSLAAMEITVPVKVQSSNGVPNVRVLFTGGNVRQFNSSDPGDYVKGPSSNPAWILLDLLTWSSLTLDQIDIGSFLAAAVHCNIPIDYTDNTGSPASHERYKIGISLRQRRAAGEIVNGVLNSMKGMLAPNGGITAGTAGKMQLFIKQTLAQQQGTKILGSNDQTPYDSALADGSPSVGYVAYHFDKSHFLKTGDDRNAASSFKITQRGINDTPTWLNLAFQDEDFSYTQDTLSLVDSEAIGRAKQQVSGGVAAEGVTTFDLGRRILQSQFAEQFRGNPRAGNIVINGNPQNDSGGTWDVNFDASFRAVHLRVGHIISITHPDYGLDAQLFRVTSLAPSMNFERISIQARWHEDDWYLDSYGQQPAPLLQTQRKHRKQRPPFAWSPNEMGPPTPYIDPIWPQTEKTFGLAQLYEQAADGTVIAKLQVHGKTPVNSFSGAVAPPYAPVATTSGAGGTFGAGHYYFALTAVDANGKQSALSFPVAEIETIGSSSSVSVPDIYWQPGTVGWKLFGGTDPNKLTRQSSGSGTPDHVDLTVFNVSDEGAPDTEFDHIEVRVTKVLHSGIIGTPVLNVSTTTITLDTNAGIDYSGRIITVIGRVDDSNDLPIWNFLVTSSTVVAGADVLTISGVTDLTAAPYGVKVGDAVVVRTQPDTVTDNTIGDSKFINNVHYFAPPIEILDASGTPIELTLATAHDYVSGDSVTVDGVTGNDAANGFWPSITVIDSTHIQIGGASSSDYAGAGTVKLTTNGLRPHFETDNLLVITRGAGAGQWRKITDNDHTTFTVDGNWGVTPDSTSEFIVLEPNWITFGDSNIQIVNSDPTQETYITVPMDNWLEQTFFVHAFTESLDGKESVDQSSPYREIYMFGGPGNVTTNYDKATFNIGVVTDLSVDTDVAPPLWVRRPGTPIISVTAKVKTPSIGADIHIDVILTKADASYTGTIFTGGTPYIVIPANSTALVTVPDASINTTLRFDDGDVWTINVLQVGSTQAGRNATIIVKWQLD